MSANVKTTTNWVRRSFTGRWHIAAGRRRYVGASYVRPTVCGRNLGGDLETALAGPDGPLAAKDASPHATCPDCISWAHAPKGGAR